MLTIKAPQRRNKISSFKIKPEVKLHYPQLCYPNISFIIGYGLSTLGIRYRSVLVIIRDKSWNCGHWLGQFDFFEFFV